MDCYAGASTGALKGISFQDGVFNNLNVISSLKPKNDEITSMCWGGDDQTELLTAQMDRKLKLYDTINNSCCELFKVGGGSGSIRGVHSTKSDKIVTAVESGELRVWSNNGDMLSETDAGERLIVMVPNMSKEGEYATGGNENPLKVWDIETGEKIFTAKNVRPDSLQLRVPVWETDVRFIPNSNNIVTTTGKYQIRLYDPRAQRRPVKELQWLEEPITAMSLCHNPMQIIAGNTRGEMALFDIRNKINMVCKYKGFAGSIRGIDAHPEAPYVASCSIDRFVRLHDVNTKTLIKKIYCKARLNRILMKRDLSLLNKNGIKKEMEDYEDDWKKIEEGAEGGTSESNTDSEEDEALWNDLKVCGDNGHHKRKISIVNEENVEPTKKAKLEEKNKRKHSPELRSPNKLVKRRRVKKLKRNLQLECDEEVQPKRVHSEEIRVESIEKNVNCDKKAEPQQSHISEDLNRRAKIGRERRKQLRVEEKVVK